MSSSISQDKLTSAVFAGGCFWCMEPPFEQLEGVKSVISGYAGGKEHQPKYKDVASGRTGHREAIQINYDANMVSYEKLLEVFWKSIDPTDGGGQFADRGHQYQSAIFYTNKEEKALAEQSLIELEKSGRFDKPVVTEILKATTFYPAEDYHQDYYKKNETHYKSYSFYSGRESFLKKMWSDSKKLKEKIKAGGNNLREKLTPLQYRITQEDGTEPAFNNEYWDNKKAGIYVDIVSGEPLFSSIEKYDSGTGWPSFYKPIEPNNIIEKVDRKLFVKRTEVRSKEANSHLGHVFSDGPKPTGLRYCINSAALRFVPLEKLEQEGYGQYIKLFKIKEKK